MGTSTIITSHVEQLELIGWLQEFGLTQASIDRHNLADYTNVDKVEALGWALGGWDAGLGIDEMNEQAVAMVLVNELAECAHCERKLYLTKGSTGDTDRPDGRVWVDQTGTTYCKAPANGTRTHERTSA